MTGALRAVHDPGKILANLAAAVALGGGLPGRHRGATGTDGARVSPHRGPVVSDPAISRLVSQLAWTQLLSLTGEGRHWEPKRLARTRD